MSGLEDFRGITTPLKQGAEAMLAKAKEPDAETEAFRSKLQSQRCVMPPADFKAAMKALEEVGRSAQLLLCRRLAEAIAEVLAPLNVPLKPGVPKRRQRRCVKPAAPKEATPPAYAPKINSQDLQDGGLLRRVGGDA